MFEVFLQEHFFRDTALALSSWLAGTLVLVCWRSRQSRNIEDMFLQEHIFDLFTGADVGTT